MKIITTEKIPIKLWLDDIEGGALSQAKNLANLPFAFRHVAIMPDSHVGYGMPIGGVLATKNVIIPNAVGVDIGCGLCSVKTSLTEINKDTLKKIMGKIREVVPLGFEHHKKRQDESLMPPQKGKYIIVEREYEKALRQIGTLGGGNHFIEIQKDTAKGNIWLMIHSGSRNFGLQIAEHYNKIAIELNKKIKSSVPENWELAHLPVDSEEGEMYIREMQYAVDFALANRKLMMDRVVDIFKNETKCDSEPMINIAHNYAALEEHFGEKV